MEQLLTEVVPESEILATLMKLDLEKDDMIANLRTPGKWESLFEAERAAGNYWDGDNPMTRVAWTVIRKILQAEYDSRNETKQVDKLYVELQEKDSMLTEAKNREGSHTRDLERIQAEIETFRQSQAKRDSEHLLNLSTLEKKYGGEACKGPPRF